MPRKQAKLDISFIKRTGEETGEEGSIFTTKVGDTVLETSSAPPESRIQYIAPQFLLDSPYQQRTHYTNIESLADKMRSLGFRGSLPARKHPSLPSFYELGYGHRRKRAAEMAGILIPVLVQEITNEQMMLLALSENFEREDLTALEEGNGFLRLSEEFRMSQEEIASFVGEERKTRIDRGYVRNRLKAAQLARQHQAVKTLLEEKPDVSLRALGYLDDEIDELGRQFILDRLGQDDWSADTVAEAVKVLKAGGEDAENLLQSQGRTLAQGDATRRPVAMPAQEVVAEAPAIHNGANGHELSDEAVQAVKRSGLLADTLKRVRRYATAVGEAVVTGDEREKLEELASIANRLLARE